MNGDDSAKSPLSEVEELREQLRKAEEEKDSEKEQRVKLEEENYKLRAQIPRKTGYLAEGTITWPVEVADIGEGEEKQIFSPDIAVGGVTFRVGAYAWKKRGEKHINSRIFCRPERSHFGHYVRGDYSLQLCSAVPGKEKINEEHFIFSNRPHPDYAEEMGCYLWKEIVEPSKGFIHDGRITIEAQIKILCIYKDIYTDFATPDPLLSDVTLIVGGHKFHSNKTYLAHHCGYFKALFFSDFAEKDKKEVELKDINSKDFECFLRVIYPERHRFLESEVVALLRMADYFDARAVRLACSRFFNGGHYSNLVESLLIAEEFDLLDALSDIVESAADEEDAFKRFKRAINEDKFKELPERLQVLVLEKYALLAQDEL